MAALCRDLKARHARLEWHLKRRRAICVPRGLVMLIIDMSTIGASGLSTMEQLAEFFGFKSVVTYMHAQVSFYAYDLADVPMKVVINVDADQEWVYGVVVEAITEDEFEFAQSLSWRNMFSTLKSYPGLVQGIQIVKPGSGYKMKAQFEQAISALHSNHLLPDAKLRGLMRKIVFVLATFRDESVRKAMACSSGGHLQVDTRARTLPLPPGMSHAEVDILQEHDLQALFALLNHDKQTLNFEILAFIHATPSVLSAFGAFMQAPLPTIDDAVARFRAAVHAAGAEASPHHEALRCLRPLVPSWDGGIHTDAHSDPTYISRLRDLVLVGATDPDLMMPYTDEMAAKAAKDDGVAMQRWQPTCSWKTWLDAAICGSEAKESNLIFGEAAHPVGSSDDNTLLSLYEQAVVPIVAMRVDAQWKAKAYYDQHFHPNPTERVPAAPVSGQGKFAFYPAELTAVYDECNREKACADIRYIDGESEERVPMALMRKTTASDDEWQAAVAEQQLLEKQSLLREAAAAERRRDAEEEKRRTRPPLPRVGLPVWIRLSSADPIYPGVVLRANPQSHSIAVSYGSTSSPSGLLEVKAGAAPTAWVEASARRNKSREETAPPTVNIYPFLSGREYIRCDRGEIEQRRGSDSKLWSVCTHRDCRWRKDLQHAMDALQRIAAERIGLTAAEDACKAARSAAARVESELAALGRLQHSQTMAKNAAEQTLKAEKSKLTFTGPSTAAIAAGAAASTASASMQASEEEKKRLDGLLRSAVKTRQAAHARFSEKHDLLRKLVAARDKLAEAHEQSGADLRGAHASLDQSSLWEASMDDYVDALPRVQQLTRECGGTSREGEEADCPAPPVPPLHAEPLDDYVPGVESEGGGNELAVSDVD